MRDSVALGMEMGWGEGGWADPLSIWVALQAGAVSNRALDINKILKYGQKTSMAATIAMTMAMAMAINDKRQQFASRAIGQSSSNRLNRSNQSLDGWIDRWIVGIAGIVVVYCLLLTFSVSFESMN